MLILFKKCPCLCSPLHTRHSLCHPRGLCNKTTLSQTVLSESFLCNTPITSMGRGTFIRFHEEDIAMRRVLCMSCKASTKQTVLEPACLVIINYIREH